ncbi:hypothetical protein EV421DRAFT_1731468 [Armillaria borealis]|uniref:DUF6534 domain-containing protein n=1 Tax=Armillaria borealis TaxID=47425 RepID=A0AA39MYS6_9AGAR|nr:hypothetical protein EV421DRAFT_1731468 [Armillaria borealis]
MDRYTNPGHIMQPVPAGHPIAELSGPIAALLNWGLFGTLSVQLYLYYLAFPNDRRFTKYLVYGIYVIEFVQTMFITHDVFATFGYGFGDMDALTAKHLYWFTVPIMSAIAAGIGQVFYAYRIFILSKSRIISIFIVCISLTNYVASMFTGVYSFQAGIITRLTSRKLHIAVGLMRSTTDFRRTRILITKIIRLTIETGSVTAVVALLSVVLFIVFPNQTFYMTPTLIMPKLYANAVYMVLNSRFQIIGGRDTYKSSTDISITTTMIRNIISQSIEETRPTDGTQGQVPVVVISSEVFSDNCEMGQSKPSRQSKLQRLTQLVHLLSRFSLSNIGIVPSFNTGAEAEVALLANRLTEHSVDPSQPPNPLPIKV